MREEDRLLVVDASNNEAAMFNLDARASRFIADRWHLDTSLSERRRSRMSSMDESAAATQKAREDTA